MNDSRFRALCAKTTWLSLFVAALGCNSRSGVHRATFLPALPPIEIDARQTLSFLASDELEGRGVGTAGLERAADFIADEFRQIGLRPLPGFNGYFQPFEMTTARAIAEKTSLRAGDRAFKLREEFAPLSFSGEGSFNGPVVFAGYGMAAPAHGYDDYADVDVKGKVVLAMLLKPNDDKDKGRFDLSAWFDHAVLSAKVTAARERGALALLLVTPPDFDGDDRLMPFARPFASAGFAIPVIQVRRAVAEELLRRGGGPELKVLQGRIDEQAKPTSFALAGVSVAGDVQLQRTVAAVKNVAGYVRGHDTPDEYVVVGAHYDHLGRGGIGSRNPRSHEIHNGADDNASGTTVVLELAARFAQRPPARSVIFIAFTAEEEGLIGSQRFVEHCPVPLSSIVAMINLDMVGRVRGVVPTTMATKTSSAPATQPAAGILYVGGGGTAAGFEQVLRQADERSPLALKDIGKGGFGPSDHMSFALKHVPVLFLFSGLHADYHRPSDDADKINYTGLHEVIDLTADVIERIAALPRQPYVEAANAASPHIGMGSLSRVTFGVVPDYTAAEESGGVRISGTTPGSPAAGAGLKEGDVIINFAGRTIDNLYDLSDALARAKPGDKVKVTYLRDRKPIQIEATLAERKG